MANYINKYTNIEAYNADDGKQYPNVSYLIDVDIIKWVKENPYIVVCKYNVTSTSSATKLLDSVSQITYQIIDNVRQDTVQTTYTFDTLGEHIVKYKFEGTSIAESAFQNCKGLTSVTIPNFVTSIGYNVFNDCTGLTSVTIGNSVTEIGSSAFIFCRGLTSITIPNSVTSIGYMAFSYCRGLTSITIPNSVTSISDYAFDGCSGLTSVTIQATTPPTLGGSSAFSDTNNCPIYVPAESVDAYKQATNWSAYADRIQAIPA